MLTNSFRGAALALVAVAGLGSAAEASSLFPNVTEVAPPDLVIQTLDISFNFDSFTFSGGLAFGSIFGNFTTVGNPVGDLIPISSFSVSTTAFSVIDGATTLLEGVIDDAAIDTNAVELLATVTGGSLAPEYLGGRALLIFSGFSANNGTVASAQMTGQVDIKGATVSAVPVPAALPLLLTGIAGLGFVARRRKAA